MEDVRAELPAGWVISGPKRTREGWEVTARPRHPLKRLLASAAGFGDSPEGALYNLAAALRQDDEFSDET